MKRFYFTFLLLTFACLFGYGQVDVTFTVDMSNETVAADGAHIAGAFNSWTGEPMTDNGDGTWSITKSLTEGDAIEYKFQNGNGGWEDFGGPCLVNGNRGFTVPAAADSLDVVCFNSCFICGVEGVTLTVDMANETVAAEGVFIAGSHNGWTDGAMNDNGDGTWSTTIGITTGETVNYKFKNGPDGWESFDGDCLANGAGSDRFVVGPAADSTAATVCFNSCEACMTGGGPSSITFTVDMANETVDAAGVRMAGAFNGWGDTLMMDNGDGTWSLTLDLDAGALVEYKFKNGPDGWEGFGGPCLASGGNRFVNVPASDATLGTVCFNSCFACGQVGVTISVDMQFETVNAEGVFIAGEFNGWTDTPISDNGDGTWTGYFGAVPGDTVEYKFKNGTGGWENFDGDCLFSGNGSNRWTPVPAQDTTIDVVCFNKCEACVVLDSVNVTFRVDMTDEVVSTDGVWLVNSLTFPDTEMTDVGNNVYEVTLYLKAGEEVEYNFRNGLLGFENIVGLPCGLGGLIGNKRLLDVPSFHLVLDAICFGKCGVCFDPYAVTSASLSNSCMNADGTVTISFDESLNCDVVAGELGGLAAIGFHTGVTLLSSGNSWQNVVAWDQAGSMNAVNDGNDVFSVTIDPAAYYGVDIADIVKLDMVFNQGPADPANPWSSEGKDADLDLNGSCDDLRVFLAQLPACTFDPATTSSPALKTAGSCKDPNTGMVKVSFDEAQNCPNANGDLAGMTAIGFHSGANSWSNVVAWDDAGAMNAVNDGSDVFEVILDPVAYYGLASFGDLENIYMVFNQGPANPGAPWDSEGKDFDADDNCVDLRFIVSDLPTCNLTNTIDRELENSLVAIPNPFDNRTVVSFSNPNNSTYDVTLFNLTGKQIRTFNQVSGTTLEIARDEMPAGMYFLNFRNVEGKIATLKLVVK
ncbi:MAG: T9SS type A sorting domain-containing protein [Saprospiraceae bacterium]